MKRILFLSLGIYFAHFSLAAADDNDDLLDDPPAIEGAITYDYKMCVQRYKNACVNDICLTSDERDCSKNCEEGALDKCPADSVIE